MRIGKRLPALFALLLAVMSGVPARLIGPTAAWSALKSEETRPEKAKAPADPEAINKLIAELGADSFKTREKAIQRLIAIGKPALEALRRTADDERADPDVRLRAARAMHAIETVEIKQLRLLGRHNAVEFPWATRAALSPDGKQAVTAGFDDLRYWDLAGGKQIRTFGGNKRGYWSLSFSRDGRRVIASGRNHNVYVFDVKTGEQIQELTGHTQEV